MRSKINQKLKPEAFWLKLSFLILVVAAFSFAENAFAQSPKKIRFVYFNGSGGAQKLMGERSFHGLVAAFSVAVATQFACVRQAF